MLKIRTQIVILLYLFAIVLANTLMIILGPQVAVVSSAVLIGLDLTARDLLHERWHGRALRVRMLVIVLTGSVLTALFNTDAHRIAFASFTAFMCAGITDYLVYERFYFHARIVKINLSNIASAFVDASLFITLAFGFPILGDVILLSFITKTIAGYAWSLLFVRVRERLDSA